MTQNQTEQFHLIYGYKDNNILRHSFNNLAQMVFGINFESFYQSGFGMIDTIVIHILIKEILFPMYL